MGDTSTRLVRYPSLVVAERAGHSVESVVTATNPLPPHIQPSPVEMEHVSTTPDIAKSGFVRGILVLQSCFYSHPTTIRPSQCNGTDPEQRPCGGFRNLGEAIDIELKQSAGKWALEHMKLKVDDLASIS